MVKVLYLFTYCWKANFYLFMLVGMFKKQFWKQDLVSVWIQIILLRLPLFFFFFFWTSTSCTVHGTWTMHLGQWTVTHASTITFLFLFLLFSVFSFQQNKWYSNAPLHSTHQFNKNNELRFFFFFFEKQTHIQERRKEVLTQRHTTTPLKNYGNF